MAATLAFPGSASADELTRAEAMARIKQHAVNTVAHPQTPFVSARYGCSGTDNHEKSCYVNYDTAATKAEEERRQAAWVCPRLPGPVQPPCGPRRPKRIAPWACVEQILAYYTPKGRGFPHPLPGPGQGLLDTTVYLRYRSAPCGPIRFSTPRPLRQMGGDGRSADRG